MSKEQEGSLASTTSQYASQGKSEVVIKKLEQVLQKSVWKGQSSFTLETIIAPHCNAFVTILACAEHIQYELPNKFSWVAFLLDNIQCSTAQLQATMASICPDNGPNDKWSDFEASTAHCLLYDPVAKQHATVKWMNAKISDNTGDNKVQVTISAFGTKALYRQGGSPSQHEFKKLMEEQKEELTKWCNAQEKRTTG